MAPHHLAKLLAPGILVLCQITTREAHPDLFVVLRNEEADIAQAVVHAGGEIALQLRLWEHMVAVLPVRVGDDALPQGDRFPVVKIPRGRGMRVGRKTRA